MNRLGTAGRDRAVAFGALIGPMLALAYFGGATDLAIVGVGAAAAAVFRWVRDVRWELGSALAPLAGLIAVSATVPVTFADAALAAVAALGWLLWVGSDGTTLATPRDRLAGIALPGFAAFLALATSLAAEGVPPSFGIVVAGGILVAVLVAAAAAVGRPMGAPAPPPSY